MKDIYSIDCSEPSWTITDEEDGWKKYKHNELDLFFLIRFNRDNAGVIEFQIWNGESYLGGDVHYGGTEERFKQWREGFMYQRQFVTWLSEKKIKVYN